MEENQVIRTLNWYYYGIMILTLAVLGIMCYLATQPDFEPVNVMDSLGMTLQYVAIGATLIALPLGLYLVKLYKPQTLAKYQEVATMRILIVGLTIPMNIAFYYVLGSHQPMMWLAAISAIGWFFTKPTLGKLDKEMTPDDPNEEKY